MVERYHFFFPGSFLFWYCTLVSWIEMESQSQGGKKKRKRRTGEDDEKNTSVQHHRTPIEPPWKSRIGKKIYWWSNRYTSLQKGVREGNRHLKWTASRNTERIDGITGNTKNAVLGNTAEKQGIKIRCSDCRDGCSSSTAELLPCARKRIPCLPLDLTEQSNPPPTL
jgi:hypothetical protein